MRLRTRLRFLTLLNSVFMNLKNTVLKHLDFGTSYRVFFLTGPPLNLLSVGR